MLPTGRPPRASAHFTMADLERETDFSARTIRFYITQGLLPPAHGRGPSSTYDRTHLVRLQAIRLLKNRRLPLDDIKAELGNLRDDEISAQLDVETAPPEDRWRRVPIHPNLELHVREPAGQSRDGRFEQAVDMIVKQAKLVLENVDRHR